tara:strand:+ start:137 stop:1897 length:1761 start_codon:yes stop_codon:yes gene_type:complete
MKIFLYLLILLFSLTIQANEVEVIELHQNKSLDSLVLEQIENENSTNDILEDNLKDQNTADENAEKEQTVLEINTDDEIENIKNLFDNIDLNTIQNIFDNSKDIKSNIIQKEFSEYLFNSNLELNDDKSNEIFYLIVNYFYNIGDIARANSIINSRNLENNKYLDFYNTIKINYLLSTFQLENLCNSKEEYSLDNNSKNNMMQKLDIFCLILENKLSEAELLNSILIETNNEVDENFQKLFRLITDYNNDIIEFNFTTNIINELIFLYSAMARIAELPLNEKFLNVDPSNMSIPIILNKATPINLRIKAANKSFNNNLITVDSLAALYLSVDFDSELFDNPEESIKNLGSDIDMIMPYYYQLVNVQIFPSERLSALISFWQFAKNNNLEHIAYALSQKITDSIEISSDYLSYSPLIAISYIYNKNFDKALNWINFYENANGEDEKSSYARILLGLYSAENTKSILEIIKTNYNNFNTDISKENEELMYTITKALDPENELKLNQDLNFIYDQRLIPSIYITEKIKNTINNNQNEFLIYSIISLNNKNWKDVHPIHLSLILEGFIKYKDGSIVNNIILEIFENYKIL